MGRETHSVPGHRFLLITLPVQCEGQWDFERARGLNAIRTEARTVINQADDGSDQAPRYGRIIVQIPEDGDMLWIQTHFLVGFAQCGSGQTLILFLPPASGEGDLTGM